MLTALAAATGVFLWSSQIARNNINVSILYFLSVFTLMMMFAPSKEMARNRPPLSIFRPKPQPIFRNPFRRSRPTGDNFPTK